MFVQQVRTSGNSLVVTIPKDVVDLHGLVEGDHVRLQIERMELRPALAPDLQKALDRSWKWVQPGLDYLKDR
ncbi:MAG: AbrB/MazE/SpoVT family DNA-binding domain-containing protein [Thermomicrobiales bacterium]